MSRNSEENNETHFGSIPWPHLPSTANRGFGPPSSTSTSPSSSVRPSTWSNETTSMTSGRETPWVYPDLKTLEGGPPSSSMILPLPRTYQSQLRQPETLPTPMRSSIHGGGGSGNVPSHEAQTVEHGDNASYAEVGRASLQGGLPYLPTHLLAAGSINRRDDIREQKRGQLKLPTTGLKMDHLLNPLPLPEQENMLDTTTDRLARLAKVESAAEQKKEDIPEESEAENLLVAANIKRKRISQPVSLHPRIPKTKSRPGRKYEIQWRVGQAPTAGLKESREKTNFDRVLAAVSRYYQGNADGTWKLALRNNATEYDGKGLTEGIGASTIMAAGLIAAGHSADATHIMNRTMPLAERMLLSQHPQVLCWLLEVSTDTSPTVAGAVRRAITAQFAPLASRLLGPDHPISMLLTTPLTTEQRIRMRKEGQLVTHDYHVRTFGIYSYQTLIHHWYWARTTAAAGHFDEAMWLLQDLTNTWEAVYPTPNSAVVVTALVERARIMVASGDASVQVECLLSDILRRIEVMSSAQSLDSPILDAAERRVREGGLIFSQLAAIRALGRVHVMRWSLNAAMLCFKQAVDIARAGLSEKSSVRKLCETDLEATRMMELERAMGVLSVEDPTSRLPPISSIISLVPIET